MPRLVEKRNQFNEQLWFGHYAFIQGSGSIFLPIAKSRKQSEFKLNERKLFYFAAFLNLFKHFPQMPGVDHWSISFFSSHELLQS